MIRVIVPDSHGSAIDPAARRAFLADVRRLDPDEIVLLGDHADLSGVLSRHAPLALADLEYSYTRDIEAAASFLDDLAAAAPRARSWHYLEGNHEAHLERWAVQTFSSRLDARTVIDTLSPAVLLRLDERGIRYYRQHERYQGLAIPNTIRLGRCYFTHGSFVSKHATAAHVEAFGVSVVHGHTHRAQAYVTRTITSEAIGGWCPGTLAKLRPTYLHTKPSAWTHGYAVQFVAKRSGRFLHVNVPIVKGTSLLGPLLDAREAAA